MCGTLGQTHVKAIGNLADLPLSAADSSGKDAKLLGEPWKSIKQLYPLCPAAPCPRRAPHQGRGRQAPSGSGSAWQQAGLPGSGKMRSYWRESSRGLRG